MQPPNGNRPAPAKPSSGDGHAQPTATKPSSSSSDDPVILYAERDYARAVQECSTRLTTEIAKICVLAACQIRNASKAKQWRASVRPSERAQLAARCKEASKGDVILAPALDCASNPLDCR